MNLKLTTMKNGENYISPETAILQLENEGMLCASTQQFNTDDTDLFEW